MQNLPILPIHIAYFSYAPVSRHTPQQGISIKVDYGWSTTFLWDLLPTVFLACKKAHMLGFGFLALFLGTAAYYNVGSPAAYGNSYWHLHLSEFFYIGYEF